MTVRQPAAPPGFGSLGTGAWVRNQAGRRQQEASNTFDYCGPEQPLATGPKACLYQDATPCSRGVRIREVDMAATAAAAGLKLPLLSGREGTNEAPPSFVEDMDVMRRDGRIHLWPYSLRGKREGVRVPTPRTRA
eukprot:scaffold2429_cov263-Pinguiococcus_pyrenoidosus.AAC.9